MADSKVLIFCVFLHFTFVTADTCYDRYKTTWYQTFYCEDCCGSWDSQYCCTYTNVGTIAGAVIGSLFGIGLLVALIVVCVKKSGGTRGLIYPNNPGGVSVIQTSQQQQGTSMYPPPPQSYPQYVQYPQNPNYPPGNYVPPGHVPPPVYTADPLPTKQ